MTLESTLLFSTDQVKIVCWSASLMHCRDQICYGNSLKHYGLVYGKSYILICQGTLVTQRQRVWWPSYFAWSVIIPNGTTNYVVKQYMGCICQDILASFALGSIIMIMLVVYRTRPRNSAVNQIKIVSLLTGILSWHDKLGSLNFGKLKVLVT